MINGDVQPQPGNDASASTSDHPAEGENAAPKKSKAQKRRVSCLFQLFKCPFLSLNLRPASEIKKAKIFVECLIMQTKGHNIFVLEYSNCKLCLNILSASANSI